MNVKEFLETINFNKLVLANAIICMIFNVSILLFNKHGTVDGFIMCSIAIAAVLLVLINNRISYLSYVVVAFIYSYISFSHALYGEFLVNLMFIIPVQMVAFFKYEDGIPTITELDVLPVAKTYYNLILVLVAFVTYGYAVILDLLGDPQPLLDAMLSVVQIFATYLMLKGKGIQWLLWVMTNLFALYLWSQVGHRYNLMMMWAFYFFNSVIGLVEYHISKTIEKKEIATLITSTELSTTK